MEMLNGFKDSKLSMNLINKIKNEKSEKISIMEVCGTHTNVILKSGIKK